MSSPRCWRSARRSGRSTSAPSEQLDRFALHGRGFGAHAPPTFWWRARASSLAALLLVLTVGACSPLYVIRAGIAEAKILAGRRPIPDVVRDSAVDERTRGKLMLAMEAREWARDSLHLDVGKSYTSFTQLESDTLALVLSAAYRDRLVPKTWWFPIVGHVPYRGFFSEEVALREQRELEAEGFDTYLRPTSAFSTLGWFADPLVSSLLREDEVDLVETIIHELSHNHLFVASQVRFNESFATFVGRVGAIDFFCRREGGGPDTVWCQRARARWRDFQRFSRWLDPLVAELEALYGDANVSSEEKLVRREQIAGAHRRRFSSEIQPELESYTRWGFVEEPLNNSTLLSQMLYFHRLPDFQALLDAHGGDVAAAVATLRAGTEDGADPFDLLPRTTASSAAAPPRP